MCLEVIELPTREWNLVWPCIKYVTERRLDGAFLTPFMCDRIPDSGLITAKHSFCASSNLYKGCPIGRGVVHSYCTSLPHVTSIGHAKRAFALGVYAFGSKGDVASKAVFIPSISTFPSGETSKLVKLLNSIAEEGKQDGHSRQIAEFFPDQLDEDWWPE